MAEETAPAKIDSATLDYVEALKKELREEIKGVSDRVTPMEFSPGVHYPRTSYSFIALNGPDQEGEWTGLMKFYMLLGLVPFGLQIGLICLLLGNIVQNGPPDLDGYPELVAAQFLAIIIFTLSTGAAVSDLIDGLTLFPSSPCKRWPRALACFCQGFQGLMAVVATMFMMATAKNVFTVLITMSAINFVSAIDGTLFDLGAKGIFGENLQTETTRIIHTKLPKVMTASVKHNRFIMVIIFVITAFSVPHIIFLTNPEAQCNFFMAISFEPGAGSHCFEYA